MGVSFAWGYRKGLDCFVEMAEKLGEQYQIVLVGTDDEIDKNLPQNIISIHRTQNQKELAEIYSAADVFAMPTREENYPTVNMEAIACGTPVVTFDTGGSPEMLNEKVGRVVPVDDVDEMINAIQDMCVRREKKNDCENLAGIAMKLDSTNMSHCIVRGAVSENSLVGVYCVYFFICNVFEFVLCIWSKEKSKKR